MKGRFGIDWFEVEKSMLMASVVVFTVSMCLSVNLIMLGFHNFDMGHNIEKLNIIAKYEMNKTFVDMGSDGYGNIAFFSGSNLIQVGYEQIRDGWTTLMVTSIMFGVSVASLRYMKESL